MKIVDLSNNNAPLNEAFFEALVAAGVGGCYFKASQGLSFDDADDGLWVPLARKHGLKVGSYHMGQIGDDDPGVEARFFLSVAQCLRPGDLIPMLDCELGSARNAIQWIQGFLDVVEDVIGTPPGVYTGDWWWRPHCPTVSPRGMERYDLWQSGYTNNEPAPTLGWSRISLWQDTDHFSVGGKNVDMSVGQVRTIPAPTPKPPPKPTPNNPSNTPTKAWPWASNVVQVHGHSQTWARRITNGHVDAKAEIPAGHVDDELARQRADNHPAVVTWLMDRQHNLDQLSALPNVDWS